MFAVIAIIKTVVLRSPGGSVRDALAMGHLIRQKQFSTEVVSGRYCASSCPLVFAGGVERRAGEKAAIGVHQVAAIKSAILSQQKFLGELVDAATRWELEGGEIRPYFPTESRALAELLQGRESMERLRTISSRVLGRQLRVCVKLEAAPMLSSTVRAAQSARELRARFEQDPIVRAMLERFGGRISEVKRRDEE